MPDLTVLTEPNKAGIKPQQSVFYIVKPKTCEKKIRGVWALLCQHLHGCYGNNKQGMHAHRPYNYVNICAFFY